MPVVKLDPSVELDPAPKAVALPKDAKLDEPASLPWYQRAGHGVADPFVGVAQIASHVLPEAVSSPVDKFVRGREETYEAERKAAGQSGTDWWRLAGNIASPINYAIPGGIGASTTLGRLALTGLSGAASGAMEPVIGDDFWGKKLKQAGVGAVAGEAGGLAARGLGRAVAPKMSTDAAILAQQGVELTPGQMGAGADAGIFGRNLRRAEEAFKSFPILGSFIRSAEGRSVESFDIATINQALEPIGQKLPKAAKAGHDAVDLASEKISDAYNALLPHVNFHVDQQFAAEIGNLRTLVAELPPARAHQFEEILKNRVARRLAPTGTMDGRSFKDAESELGYLARTYQRSQDGEQRQLGHAINEIRTAMRDVLERQNPQHADRLRDINSSYAMLTRVEGAAGRRLGGTGVFTPLDLLSAVRSGDASTRKRAFAHGDALMQDWAGAAQRVLPGKMPDSGTGERLMYLGSAAGLLGGAEHFGVPGGPEAAAALAMGALPYTRLGGRAVQAAATPGPTRLMLGETIRGAAPFAAPAGAVLATHPSESDIMRRAAQPVSTQP